MHGVCRSGVIENIGDRGEGAVEIGQAWWWVARLKGTIGLAAVSVEGMGMRRVKRVILFVAQGGVLVVGPVAALALGVLVDNIRGDLAALAFLVGLIATLAGFVLLVLRNTARRMEYDAADYPIEKANCRLHPRRERWKRAAKKIAMWAPSAIAAFVLFYFPQATHVLHPWATNLGPYSVPVPWRFVVLPVPYAQNAIWVFATKGKQRRFGITWIWVAGPFSAEMDFASIEEEHSAWPHAVPPGVAAREFDVGGVVLACRESVNPRRKAGRIVNCGTPSEARQWNLNATFFGAESDLAEFYGIMRGVRLLQFAK
jgi:hypothetical protein